MDLRDLIVWVGLAAICLIIWDGLRRMKAARPAAVRSKKAKPEDDYVDPEEEKKKAEIARELPNGGARIREMTDTEKSAITTRLNLRERVPMLMERVEVEPPEDRENESEDVDPTVLQSEMDFSLALAEPEFESDDEPEVSVLEDAAERREDFTVEADASAEPNIENNTESESTIEDLEANSTHDSDPGIEMAEQNQADDEADEEQPIEESTPTGSTTKVEESQSESIDPGPVEDLVVIHVMAKKGEVLSGSSVLDLLITAGLRHGPMDIFHYRNPKGITEFSLANCVQPGTFDPDSMNQVNTPGVTLFMQLPTAADSMESFDHMYEMARFLAKHIDAEILDEDHSTVTPQRIEYYREKLRSFERTRLIPS
jgi:cell division protein ZipA